jgi:hypothetical protein
MRNEKEREESRACCNNWVQIYNVTYIYACMYICMYIRESPLTFQSLIYLIHMYLDSNFSTLYINWLALSWATQIWSLKLYTTYVRYVICH